MRRWGDGGFQREPVVAANEMWYAGTNEIDNFVMGEEGYETYFYYQS